MNFHTLCKFYGKNSSKVRNKKQFKHYLTYFYNIWELKKAKLKLGAVTFEMKPFVINGVIIRHSFEMVFSRQPLTNNPKKQIENILTFFQWSWDFKNILTLIMFLWLLIYYIRNIISTFYTDYITSSIVDRDHLDAVLNHIFLLVESKPLNQSFICYISNILADLSIYLNLF